MVTFDKKGKPIMEAEVRIPYELALGPSWYRFFEGLKDEKILGTRCDKCDRVLVPARTFCPRCFVEMEEWLEVSQVGEVISWVLTDYEYFGMPTKPPFISALIRLDETDCSFMHLIGGFDLTDLDTVTKTVINGMKVRAVWNEVKNGCILDIKYFRPL